MKSAWPWVFGIAAGLLIIALLFGGRSDQQTYWIARGTVVRPVQVTQVEDVTMIRYHCRGREGSIKTAEVCGFYVWKK